MEWVQTYDERQRWQRKDTKRENGQSSTQWLSIGYHLISSFARKQGTRFGMHRFARAIKSIEHSLYVVTLVFGNSCGYPLKRLEPVFSWLGHKDSSDMWKWTSLGQLFSTVAGSGDRRVADCFGWHCTGSWRMLGRAMPRSYRKTMQNPFLFLNFSSNVKALCQIWTGRIGIVEAYCHILPYIAIYCLWEAKLCSFVCTCWKRVWKRFVSALIQLIAPWPCPAQVMMPSCRVMAFCCRAALSWMSQCSQAGC